MDVRFAVVPLVLALSVACVPKDGSSSPFSGGSTENAGEALAKVDENLARLNALAVIPVDTTASLMGTNGNCYGSPCNDAEALAIAEEQQLAAVSLALFTDAAEEAAGTIDHPPAFDRAAVDADVLKLGQLGVVTVYEFVQTEPGVTGHCYGPCEAEIQAALDVDAERAAILHEWVVAATPLALNPH